MLAIGVLVFVSLAVLLPSVSKATLDTPQILSYQGRLTDAQKVTVPDGVRSISFIIYNDPVAVLVANCKWTAVGTCASPGTVSVTVADGLFNILLGDTGSGQIALPDSLFNTTEGRWLEVRIDGETLSPRRRIGSSATALQAGNASLLDGFDTSQSGGSAAFVPVTDSGGHLTLTRNLAVGGRILAPVHSASQGLRVPTNAGAPSAVVGTEEGDVVWDSTGNTLYAYDGAAFVSMSNPNTFVQSGNSFAALATLGTNDANALALETKNIERLRILATGNVGIGTTTPTSLFSVGATSQFQVSSAGIIAAAAGITSSGTITFSGFSSNGGPLFTNGSGALSQATAGTSSQILHGGAVPSFGAVALATEVSGTLPVGNGGTGATTFTPNGILYGNTTSAIQVTAQGGANSILIANAGVPSFSDAPTIGTSVTTPLLIGGAAAASILTLESTSGVGTTDAIIFKTASQSEKMRITTTGQVGIGTAAPGAGTLLDVNGIINSATGFRIANAATAGNFLRGDGTNFVSNAIQSSDVSGFAFIQGGNSFGPADAILGTNDAFALTFETNNVERGRFDSTGNFWTGGVTTVPVGVHASFVPDGNDAFVNGDFAAQDSVYANSFTSGTGGILAATTYGESSTVANGAFTLQSTGALTLSATTTAGADDVIFNTAGSEKMRILENGNVGIGTGAPLSRLDVNGGVAIGSYAATSAAPANGLIVSGNIGIGTTTPSSKLQVQTIAENGTTAITTYDNASLYSSIDLQKSNSASATNVATVDGNILGQFRFQGNDGSGFLNGGLIQVVQTGAVGADVPARMDFVTANGTTAGVKMSIDKDGNIGIGTTAPSHLFTIAATASSDAVSAAQRFEITNSATVGGNGLGFGTDYYIENANGNNNAVAQFNVVLDDATEGSEDSSFRFITRAAGAALSEKVRIDSTGNVGIGTSSPNSRLEVLSTSSPQLRMAYDGSNYTTMGAASNGATTFDATGAGASFVFSDAVSFTGDLTPATDIAYDLGSAAKRWRELYLGPASLKMYSTTTAIGGGTNDVLAELKFIGTTGAGALNLTTTRNGSATGGQINLTSDFPSGNTTSSAFNFTTATNLGATDEVLQIGDSGGTFVTVLGNGDVGIGTATPISQLHAAGKVPSAAAGSISTGTTPTGVYVQGRYAYVVVAGASDTLRIFDVSNSASPAAIGSVSANNNPSSVYVQGLYAYVVSNTAATLQIFDVSNPASPSAISSVATGSSPESVYVQGRYAYVVNSDAGTLQVFDVSNPVSPVVVGSVATGSLPRVVSVQGRYAYVAMSGSLKIYDVSNPASPTFINSVASGINPYGLYVQGRYAYETDFTDATLRIFDISNPASPSSAGSIATAAVSTGIFVQGRYVYLTNWVSPNSLQVFDVSTPGSPTSVGSVTTGTNPYSVYVQGRYAYVINYSSATLQVFDMGGAYIQQLEAGGIETGTLTTRSNVQVGNDLDIRGGMQVGRGMNVTGPVSIYGGAANSQFTIDQTGRVGIGTAPMGDKLTVQDGNVRLHNSTDSNDWVMAYDSTDDYYYIDELGKQRRLKIKNQASGGGMSIGYPADSTPDGELDIEVSVAANKGIVLTGAASQTGNLMELQNSFAARLLSVDAAGEIVFGKNANHNISIESATATDGRDLTITSGNTTNAFGTAGALNLAGGASNDGSGGAVNLYGGTGATGGAVTLRGGNGGSPGETGGNISVLGGSGVSANDGDVNIGTSHTKAITIGYAGMNQPAVAINSRVTVSLIVATGITGPYALCHDTNGAGIDEIKDCNGGPMADYAEQYPVEVGAAMGDIVMIGTTDVTTTQGDTIKELIKSSAPYEAKLIGVISDPATAGDFNSIGYNINPADNPLPVALVGRVKVKVNDENGSIAVGDPITSSSTAGEGMKSTKSGMIVGRALSAFAGPGAGTVMVFVKTEYYLGATLTTDGTLTYLNDSVIVKAKNTATALVEGYDSQAISFTGSGWDGAAAQATNFKLSNITTNSATSRLAIANTAGAEVFSVNQSGDVVITGKLFPSDKGVAQTSKYIYYDSDMSPSDYMRTNAAGWATGSYDFAELFPTKDETLGAGEVVAIDPLYPEHVKRADSSAPNLLLGIISTRPGFLAGEWDKASKKVPVALAGRVPTKVTVENGPIAVGDALTVSPTRPGFATKATASTRKNIGYALEATLVDASIIVYVKTENAVPTNLATESTSQQTQNFQIYQDVDFRGFSITNIKAIRGQNWSIDENGALVVKSVSSNEYIVQVNEEKATIDTAYFPANSDMVVITNASVHENSRIFLTFRGDPGARYWVNNQAEGSFEIRLSSPAVMQLRFEYWIINVNDTRPVTAQNPVANGPVAPTTTPTVPAESTVPTAPATTTTPTEPAAVIEPVAPAAVPDPVPVTDPVPNPVPAPDPVADPAPEPAPAPISDPAPAVEPVPATDGGLVAPVADLSGTPTT